MFHFGHISMSYDQIKSLLVTDHPMIEEFKLVFVEETKLETARQFELQIILKPGVHFLQQRDLHGYKLVDPIWKTTIGQEKIGMGLRTIFFEGYDLVAQNSRFFPNQEYNDLGIGSALYVSMERLYRAWGINKCRLHAVAVGRYAWARQGFDFLESGVASSMNKPFVDFITSNGGTLTIPMQHAWNFANFDIGWNDQSGYKIGKHFMLNHFNAWYGIKYLNDKRMSKIAENSRREVFAKLPAKIDGAHSDLAVR